ncbi:MAG: sensor histidine kinase [Pontibacterium sp.]
MSILIFLTSFLVSAYYDSKKVIKRQVEAHTVAQVNHYENQLTEYLNDLEQDFLTLRSNKGLVESLYQGDQGNFFSRLAEWEEDVETTRYDFIALSFFDKNKCFLFSGYLTNLSHITCADLFIKNGSLNNHGWKVIEANKTVLGIYSLPLSLNRSGKVIGQLIGGIKLSDNEYLLSKMFSDQNELASIGILYKGNAISTVYFESSAYKETSLFFLEEHANTVAVSQGETPFSDNIVIKTLSDDRSLSRLREEISKTFIYGGSVALVISLTLALLLSGFVDFQLQSLITFTRKAHRNKHTCWKATNIEEFNAIGAEIIEIVKDLKDKEDALLEANKNLNENYQDKRRILHHLIDTEEKQRLRLSNELHDDMGQLLAAVKVNLHFLKQEIIEAKIPTRTVELSEDIVNSMYDTVYNRIMSLRPFEMNDFGLNVSLPKIATIAQLESMDYAIEMDIQQDKKLSEGVMSNLYRIAQEALSNIMKHACGTYVFIQLKDEDLGVRLVIEDDGVGIPEGPRDLLKPGGFGLISIRERTEYIHGTLSVESREGCSINVFVPSLYAYV